jgi:L-aminopeptidase/D-esterase-like protein
VITDVPGVSVGHWTDAAARTGCTVVRFPEGSVASGEVRGGAPATREFELLHPEALVARIDAVVLSGGSAFGLAAADGVTRALADEGVGFPTVGGPVPIVVAMSLYDLAVGDGSVRPTAGNGEAATRTASAGPHAVGLVGAGTGATVGKWQGRDTARPGGLVTATERDGDLIVSALIVVNAWGDVDDGARRPWPPPPEPAAAFGENTTIGVVATNARLDKVGCLLVAQGGHDGLARAISPPHARADGDALVAVSSGGVEAPVDHVRWLALLAVERAIRRAGATR